MELKHITAEQVQMFQDTSNCTNMELKPNLSDDQKRRRGASNCTNMELKRKANNANKEAYELLIAPIWN